MKEEVELDDTYAVLKEYIYHTFIILLMAVLVFDVVMVRCSLESCGRILRVH